MKKRKLKPFVVPMLYTLAIALFVGSMYFLEQMIDNQVFSSNEEETNYVGEEIIENNDYLPVVSEAETFIKPYQVDNVQIVKNFYDYQAEAEEQEQSIIYYENTYMQNAGVDYSNGDTFDVVSSINGTVESIKEDDICGTTITIKNANNITIVYQSVSEVSVTEGQTVSLGQIIATSGTSNINSDLGKHLHFELYLNDTVVNPEDYYNKTLDEMLQG
jgi:stage II sporulation protein Q